jgi:hypothetical protein
MGLLDFHSDYKNIARKHSSFWPLADVKPMSNDAVHAISWQCMFALSLSLSLSLSIYVYTTNSLIFSVTKGATKIS